MRLLDGDFRAGAQTVQRDFFAPASGYGAIYADPPWRFETRSSKGRGRSPDWIDRSAPLPLLGVAPEAGGAPKHYATLDTNAICDLDAGRFAARDCVLYLWAVLNMLDDAMRVGRAWGFAHRTARIWVKTRVAGFDPALTLDQNFPMGTGYIVRGNPEALLVFVRGEPRFRCAPRALVIAPRREHSRKPDIVRHDIERQVAGPYLELFARQSAPGWDCWGNQLDRFGATA